MKYRESQRMLQARAKQLSERLQELRDSLREANENERPMTEVAIQALEDELVRIGRELRRSDHALF